MLLVVLLFSPYSLDGLISFFFFFVLYYNKEPDRRYYWHMNLLSGMPCVGMNIFIASIVMPL